MTLKTCSKCKEEKDIDLFDISSHRKDGHYPQCKNCRSENYKENKEKIIEYQSKYYCDNKKTIIKNQMSKRYSLETFKQKLYEVHR